MFATTHRVIVTDPVTHAVLESGMLFPIIASAVAFVLSFMLVSHVFEKRRRGFKKQPLWVTLTMWGIPLIITVLVFNHFNI